MEEILNINELSKKYGRIQALNNFSLTVKRGEVWGILGPNGSGKTTTLGIILGVINCDQGNFTWFGQPISPVNLKRTGALLEHPNFYPYLSAEKNLELIAILRNVDRLEIERVLRFVNLYERRKHRFQTFSLGMKQRLAIASAMLGSPEVLILDEPTNGLDPTGIAEIRALISKLAAEGTTIILASHLLDEVQKVCSHAAVLSKGNNLFSGNVSEVLNQQDIIEVASENLTKLTEAISLYPGFSSCRTLPSHIEVVFTEKTDPALINTFLFEQGIVCSHLALRKKSLEKYYLELLDSKIAQKVK